MHVIQMSSEKATVAVNAFLESATALYCCSVSICCTHLAVRAVQVGGVALRMVVMVNFQLS